MSSVLSWMQNCFIRFIKSYYPQYKCNCLFRYPKFYQRRLEFTCTEVELKVRLGRRFGFTAYIMLCIVYTV